MLSSCQKDCPRDEGRSADCSRRMRVTIINSTVVRIKLEQSTDLLGYCDQ